MNNNDKIKTFKKNHTFIWSNKVKSVSYLRPNQKDLATHFVTKKYYKFIWRIHENPRRNLSLIASTLSKCVLWFSWPSLSCIPQNPNPYKSLFSLLLTAKIWAKSHPSCTRCSISCTRCPANWPLCMQCILSCTRCFFNALIACTMPHDFQTNFRVLIGFLLETFCIFSCFCLYSWLDQLLVNSSLIFYNLTQKHFK